MPAPNGILDDIIAVQQVKLTRIGRITRLMTKLGDLDREIIKYIQKLPYITDDLAEELTKWSRRHDNLREEIGEAATEATDSEKALVKAYVQLIERIWKNIDAMGSIDVNGSKEVS